MGFFDLMVTLPLPSQSWAHLPPLPTTQSLPTTQPWFSYDTSNFNSAPQAMLGYHRGCRAPSSGSSVPGPGASSGTEGINYILPSPFKVGERVGASTEEGLQSRGCGRRGTPESSRPLPRGGSVWVRLAPY